MMLGNHGNPERLVKEMPPRLFIGPWVGEFGVELLRWQGLARSMAKSQRWNKIIVATQRDKFFLYEDFATDLIHFTQPSMHALGAGCRRHNKAAHPFHDFLPTADDVWLSPFLEPPYRWLLHGLGGCRAAYRNFSEDAPLPEKRYDILIHARATHKANQNFKNWSVANWAGLVQALGPELRIASIGAIKGAHKIAGTDDLRGIPLNELAGHCAAARLMVGPSSGPIHFGLHCGLPVITWVGVDAGQTYKGDVRRLYYPQWNPFAAPLCCMRGWQPPGDVVLSKIQQILELLKSRSAPIRYLVCAADKTASREIIEWIAQVDSDRRYVHWRDCLNEGVITYPHQGFVMPTQYLWPKAIHAQATHPFLQTWNDFGSEEARVLSMERVSLPWIASLEEAQQASRLVFVVRDAVNLLAVLKLGMRELRNTPFSEHPFKHIVGINRSYLVEAVGKTRFLGALLDKSVFISYNRWHRDESYRTQIAAELDLPMEATNCAGKPLDGCDCINGAASSNGSGAFDSWQHFMSTDGFWEIACDAEIATLEAEFHGAHTPLSSPLPQRSFF